MAAWALIQSCSSGLPAPSRGQRETPANSAAGAIEAASVAGATPIAPAQTQQPDVAKSAPADASASSSCQEAVVLFVVDGSGSMSANFGAATRWTALRAALLDPKTGFVPRLEKDTLFGTLIYDAPIDVASNAMISTTPAVCGAPAASVKSSATTCPRFSNVAPKRQNLVAINAMFPAKEPGGSTPTAKALFAATEQLLALKDAGSASLRRFIVLATDGEPNDLCPGTAASNGDAEKACVLTAVDRAAAAGITIFVISLAGDDKNLEAHLVDVAKHGNPKDPSAHTFSPMTPDDLVMTLRTVLTSALGCELL